MLRSFVAVAVALGAVAGAPAWAGPTKVLSSRSLEPNAPDAAYAVAPSLDPATRAALVKGLTAAGLRVTTPEQPHGYLVTVDARVANICTFSCNVLVQHNDSNLDDYYRRVAVVAAQENPGVKVDSGRPLAWYTVLQSDGLSNRQGDYLPALLRYGSRAYGRSTAPDAPPSR